MSLTSVKDALPIDVGRGCNRAVGRPGVSRFGGRGGGGGGPVAAVGSELGGIVATLGARVDAEIIDTPGQALLVCWACAFSMNSSGSLACCSGKSKTSSATAP